MNYDVTAKVLAQGLVTFDASHFNFNYVSDESPYVVHVLVLRIGTPRVSGHHQVKCTEDRSCRLHAH